VDGVIGGKNLQLTRETSGSIGLSWQGGAVQAGYAVLRISSGGTTNRIIVIGDTYLELIAVRTPAEAQQSMLERLTRGDGYLNFVLSSNDIEADTAAMALRGVSVIGPTPGQLKAPDGHTRGWSAY